MSHLVVTGDKQNKISEGLVVGFSADKIGYEGL